MVDFDNPTAFLYKGLQKFDPETTPQLVYEKMTALGFQILVCEEMGISRQSLNSWVNGDIPKTVRNQMTPAQWKKYKTVIREALDAGKAIFDAKLEAKCIAAILKGEKGWQGKAWILERCFGEKYKLFSNTSKVIQETTMRAEIKNSDSIDMKKVFSVLSADEKKTLAALMAKVEKNVQAEQVKEEE